MYKQRVILVEESSIRQKDEDGNKEGIKTENGVNSSRGQRISRTELSCSLKAVL